MATTQFVLPKHFPTFSKMTLRGVARSVDLTWFRSWPVKLSSRPATVLLDATCSPIAALVLSLGLLLTSLRVFYTEGSVFGMDGR
jgi:hypothetical protein